MALNKDDKIIDDLAGDTKKEYFRILNKYYVKKNTLFKIKVVQL